MSINIKGKEYVTVNERVNFFRTMPRFKDYSLESEIITLTDEICVIRAIIKDSAGRIVATGLAREEKQDKKSLVNLNAFLENCETSAWGRALGNLGIGVEVSIASADEMKTKISHICETLEDFEEKELKTFDEEKELKTFDDFKSEIENAKVEKYLGKLWHKWKEIFPENTEEYQQLNELAKVKKAKLKAKLKEVSNV